MILLDAIKTTAAVVAAIGVIGGAAWAVGDNTGYWPVWKRDLNAYDSANKATLSELRQMAENATRLGMAAQFNILYEKKLKCDCLSFQEQQDLCRLGRELGYTGIPGC